MLSNQEKGRRADLKKVISASVKSSGGDFKKFEESLKSKGVGVKLTASKEGKVCGISYQQNGQKPMKGSTLGKSFGWAGLTEKLKKSADFALQDRKKLLPQNRKKLPLSQGKSAKTQAKGSASTGAEAVGQSSQQVKKGMKMAVKTIKNVTSIMAKVSPVGIVAKTASKGLSR